jgi:glycosyltransferase involved in cell wall biosynthesis
MDGEGTPAPGSPRSARPLRILLSTPRFFPHVGGLEVLVSTMAQRLSEAGHAVRLMTSHDGSGIFVDDHHGIPVLQIDSFRILSERDPAGILRAQRAVMDFVREFDPDVIHAHDTPPTLWLYLRRKPQGAPPVIITLHIVMSRHAAGTFQSGREMLNQADWITGVSRDVVDDALLLDPSLANRMSLVTNGVVVPTAHVSPVADGPPHFLAVGRLVEQKGFDRAIAAVARLLPRHPELRLTIIGSGGLREDLEALISELGVGHAVRLAGPVPHDAVAECIRNAVAVVMPSRLEGLPLTALEAAWMARPVVGTNVPGLSQAVRDGETGLLVPEHDIDALAGAIELLAVDRQLARALGAAARARAEREWSVDVCVDHYLAIYRKLAPATGA